MAAILLDLSSIRRNVMSKAQGQTCVISVAFRWETREIAGGVSREKLWRCRGKHHCLKISDLAEHMHCDGRKIKPFTTLQSSPLETEPDSLHRQYRSAKLRFSYAQQRNPVPKDSKPSRHEYSCECPSHPVAMFDQFQRF